MNQLWEDLRWRGLIYQVTEEDALVQLLEQPQSVYVGFDPTADSLHVGSLLGLMMLRRFQAAGHRPIVVLGGATGMIGDPSGKSEERNLLDPEVLEKNTAAMQEQMRRFLDFSSSPRGALLVNNYDWMKDFSFLSFLRDVGKHFPVNVMLAKDSVRSRLEKTDSGISYTEFSYMLLQAYDFVYLYDHYGCRIQLGGSDQWGNITAGIDLARRMRHVTLYGATWPLLVKADGGKMGKTESGTIWLSPHKTSPYLFYQYWYNVSDEDVGKCLRYLTELPREEIEALDEARREAPHLRDSQRRLAEWLTQLVHGPEGLAEAQRASRLLFGEEIAGVPEATVLEVFAHVPGSRIPRSRLGSLTLVEALVASGLANSRGEARRAIEQGGAYINNRRVTDIEKVIGPEDLLGSRCLVLRRGKKNYALVEFVNQETEDASCRDAPLPTAQS
ncbi:MAG: tyrosine--tRNA ligase [Pirellulaceae bacterium]|nr:MAG: tyrosine--tRNA ligase [Pirellulaceae bacterium]